MSVYSSLAFVLLVNIHFCYGYKYVRLQDYLCADKFMVTIQKTLKGENALTLGEDRDSGAIITQTWNATGLNRNIEPDCVFRIQTIEKPKRGIYTVITKLKLRRDSDGSCLDYIQFSGGKRSPTKKICNNISIDGPGERLLFDERDRDVTVHIFINKRTPILDPLELHMIMTSHSECKYTGDFLCDPKDAHSCISRHFVRDNITNCMYPCKDENSCFLDAITAEVMDTTNVAISAITSLIFTMLGVGFCIWICWKYWNCITIQQHAHEASSQNYRNRETPTIELPNAPAYNDIFTPAIDQQMPTQTPKDLPPSYESLFPDR